MNKKPRKIDVNIHINQGDSLEGIWDKENQIFKLKVAREGKNISAEKIHLSTYYERPKKKKYLNHLEFGRSSEFTVSTSEALSLYTAVWAIDTNKKTIFNKIVNVTSIMACSTDGSNDFYPVLSMVFGETEGNPELFAWRKFIEFFYAQKFEMSCDNKYALIVDSELGRIPSFNAREEAIHCSFVLPEAWNLIYASADVGKENFLNRAISGADKISNKIFELVEAEKKNSELLDPVRNEDDHEPVFIQLVINKKPNKY